jgi:sulfonate transport system substrate-binding protein
MISDRLNKIIREKVNPGFIIILCSIIMLCSLLLIVGCDSPENIMVDDPVKVTIAVADQPIGSLVYIANEQGFFREEGLEVNLISYTSGKDALNQGLLKENANFAFTAETPVMYAVMQGQKILIGATIGSSSKNMAIVAKNSIRKEQDLIGKKIAVTQGTNGAFFLDVFLTLNNLQQKVEVVNKKPEELVDALINDEVSAVVVWNPHLNILKNKLPDGIYFYQPGVYTWTWNLVMGENLKPSMLKKVLGGLLKAEDFIKKSPVKSLKILSQEFNIEEQQLEQIISELVLGINLEQSLILSLEDQTRWAIQNNLTSSTTMPNYLNYIHFSSLEELDPVKVSIIH